MAFRITHLATYLTWTTSTSKTAQLTAIRDALGASWVARIEGTAAAQRRLQTYPLLTINASPKKIIVGAPLTDAASSEGDIVRVVCLTAGGTEIMRIDAQAGSGPATLDFAGPVKTACRPTLTGCEILPTAALPDDDTPTPMTWQYLTVASHSRRVPPATLQGAGGGSFNPAKAQALELVADSTVTSVPIRAFSATIHDGNGKFFLCGGLHSNYQGNEIDEITLPGGSSTVCTVRVSHASNMPPEGPQSGYEAGSGGYLWRMYGSAMPDPTLWQPYPGHQWTKQIYHPTWGFCSLTPYATTTGGVVGGIPQGSIATDASGYVIPSPDAPIAGYERRSLGLVSFDWTTGRYTTRLTNDKPSSGDPDPAAYFGQTGVSDYSAHLSGFFGFETRGGVNTAISFVPNSAARAYIGQTTQIGGYDNTGGNGILVRELELGRFLVLRQDSSANSQPGYDGSPTFRLRLLHWDSTSGGVGTFTTLTPPSGVFTGVGYEVDCLTFAVDKVGRRVFWMVFPNPGVACRFYVSSFDSLMTWTLLEFTNTQVVPTGAYQDSYIATDRQPMHYWNGYLVMNSKGFINGTEPVPYPNDGWINNGCTFMRAYVGPA